MKGTGMNERLEQRKAMMLNNTMRILIFAILAILFNKWWIVLISGLFLIYEKEEQL